MFQESPIGYNPEFVKRVLASRDQKTREEANEILREAALESQRIIVRARNEAKRIIAGAEDERARIITMARLETHVREATVRTANTSTKYRSADEIAMEMATSIGVTLQDVKGRNRSRQMSAARHAVISAVYVQRPDMSLNQIGRYFNRDHTSILHSVQQTGVWRGVEQG